MRGVLLVLLAAAILPSLAIQVILVSRWFNDTRHKQIQSNMEVARAVGITFKNHMEDLAVSQIALGEAVKLIGLDSRDRLEVLLDEQARQYAAVNTIVLAALDGRVLASSQPSAMEFSVSDRVYFQLAVRARKGQWVLGNLIRGRIEDEYTVAIARSIYDGDRRVAVIGFTIDLDRLSQDVVNLRREEGGTAQLFDRNGRLVFRDPYIKLTNEQRDAFYGVRLSKALAGEEVWGEEVSPIAGEHRVIALTPVEDIGWVSGAGMSVARMNQAAWSAIYSVLWVNLAIMLTCIVVLVIASKVINSDVSRLTKQFIGESDLDQAHQMMRTDDFYMLSSAFASAIHKRDEAVDQLRLSEARYSSLFHNNHAVMFLIDSHTGDIVDSNAAASDFYGYTVEQLTSMNISQINTLSPAEVADRLAEIKQQRKRSFEFTHKLASGEFRNVQVYSGPMTVDGRELLYSIIHDVTEQVRAQQALKESELRFRTVANTLPQLVWAARPDGYPIYFNDRWYAYTGQVPGQNDGDKWFELVHPDDRERTVNRFRECIQTHQPYEMEFRLRRASDGQYRWFLSRALPIRTNGKTIMWMGTDTEIHEKTEQRERLAQVLEELRRSNEDLQQFAYVASHDLREPLRMISGFLGLIRDRHFASLDEEVREFITFAADGAERMDDLLKGLLEYSRVSTKGGKGEPVAMMDAFRQAMANLSRAVRESQATVHSDDLPIVCADFTQMTQLLQNLIANALKFRRDNVPPRVMVSATRQEGMWLFRVSDNGIGIEPRDAQRIFVIFQRLHIQDRYEGSGIGLAICKKIIERHGGRIWLESTPGEGSIFYFTLPPVEESA